MSTVTGAKILADSISPAGHRITTFEAVYPRIILAEVNTHRVLSRVSASSRAIPVEKMICRVMDDPYVPTHWGKNQKGMQAEQDVDAQLAEAARSAWKNARGQAVLWTRALLDIGIHKQITNRLLEPFMWHPTVLTATDWDNFWHLRDHAAAHPDFRDLVSAMREEYLKGDPEVLGYDEWHTPYINPEDYDAAFEQGLAGRDSQQLQKLMCKVSVGRCARVSTLTHDGKRDLQADVNLHDKMGAAGHMSPYEHVARPMTKGELDLFKQKKMRWNEEHQCWVWVGAKYRHMVDPDDYEDCEAWDHDGLGVYRDGEYTHFLGNAQGWVQARKLIPFEEDILGARA